jgi:predicted N-acetyltransferase YhbS
MIEIRPLQADDDRTCFRSGNPDLDRFFHKYAGQNQFRHHIGITLVAVERKSILGFATIAASEIEIERLPKKSKKRLPKYPLPVLRLARLAVDQASQGRGVGKILLREVFRQSHEMAERYGCVGVVVDAKPDVVPYYQTLGFKPMEVVQGQLLERPQQVPMFLPLGSIPKG